MAGALQGPTGRSPPIRSWGRRGGSVLQESPEDKVASCCNRSIEGPSFWVLTINELVRFALL